MTAQDRRKLLEGLVAKIDKWLDERILWVKDAALLCQLREMAAGALLGDLADDAAWAQLLEMLAQEVADGNENA